MLLGDKMKDIHDFENRIAEGLCETKSLKGVGVFASVKTPELPEGAEIVDSKSTAKGIKSTASFSCQNSVAISFANALEAQYWVNQLKAFNDLDELEQEDGDSFLVNHSKKPLWGVKWLKTAADKAILFLTRLF